MTLDRVVPHRPAASTPRPPDPLGSLAPTPRASPKLSLPAPERGSLPPAVRNKTTAAEIRGRPAAELSIETAAEQLDHKGRSKPIFAPRSPRPQHKRMHPVADLATGLFPGARLMARERVASGLAYAIVGALALLPAVMVLVGWSARAAAVERLGLTRVWLAGHGAVLVASVALFELVRCLSALEPARRHVRGARIVSALGLPALLVVVGAPLVVADAPSLVEPVWFAALPLAALAAIAAVDVLARPDPGTGRRAMLVATAAVLASVLVVTLILIVSIDTRAGLVRRATAAGFARLPAVLRAMNVGT